MTDFAPDSMHFSEFTVVALNSVSMTQSPYSQAQTVYDFGGALWRASATLVSCASRARQADIEGWILGLDGPRTPFLMHNFDFDGPFGLINGELTIAVDAMVGVSEIAVQHTLFSEPPRPALVRGDWVTIGERLHRVSSADDTDAAGVQVVRIWPPLRANAMTTDPVIVDAPFGIWRMSGDPFTWRHDWASGRDITIEMIEFLE